MAPQEIAGAYKKEICSVIIGRFRGIDPAAVLAVLVYSHGPFAWGKDPKEAAHNAVVLEKVAQMAWPCLSMKPELSLVQQSCWISTICASTAQTPITARALIRDRKGFGGKKTQRCLRQINSSAACGRK